MKKGNEKICLTSSYRGVENDSKFSDNFGIGIRGRGEKVIPSIGSFDPACQGGFSAGVVKKSR